MSTFLSLLYGVFVESLTHSLIRFLLLKKGGERQVQVAGSSEAEERQKNKKQNSIQTETHPATKQKQK